MIVLIPFGTCTQGDDGPWSASFIYSVVPIIGLVLILVSSKKTRESLMGIPHVLTLLLILLNTPSYWLRVTFQGQHICAGFQKDNINSFQPELWHRLWAPYVTIIGLAFFLMGIVFFKNHIKAHRTLRIDST
ncbi:MAG: hypothetical protein HGB26_07900 [Desulfobulbaceae bacterium]|nr:hypothetical protein [Desulfobulbaceae bacterium]